MISSHGQKKSLKQQQFLFRFGSMEIILTNNEWPVIKLYPIMSGICLNEPGKI